jgi:hypothetical protein
MNKAKQWQNWYDSLWPVVITNDPGTLEAALLNLKRIPEIVSDLRALEDASCKLIYAMDNSGSRTIMVRRQELQDVLDLIRGKEPGDMDERFDEVLGQVDPTIPVHQRRTEGDPNGDHRDGLD